MLTALSLSGRAEAASGVYPNGHVIDVEVSSLGHVVRPESVRFVFAADHDDFDVRLWVSDSPGMTRYGSPHGADLGYCARFSAWIEAGKYYCDVRTRMLRLGSTYYWWVAFRRRDASDLSNQHGVSGPFTFSLRGVSTPAPISDQPEDAESESISTATLATAPTLRSSWSFDGVESVKHTTLTQVVYKTMKLVARPRMLAVACWTENDYDAVRASIGAPPGRGRHTYSAGFWTPLQPRWLHLVSTTCDEIQALFDSGQVNGIRAEALAIALHEATHAYGVRNEAAANCYSVQLVPIAAYYAGLPWKRASYAGKLAFRATRRSAPPGYWSPLCRDGGPWDLAPRVKNLGG